jgi:hypothetical protein
LRIARRNATRPTSCSPTVDLGALLADHDARTSGPQLYRGLVSLALNLNSRNRGAAKSCIEETADLDIVLERLGVVLTGIPAGAPVLGDA